MASTLLYSKDLSVDGIWNGGGAEVYTQGNQFYCFKPISGSSVDLKLKVSQSGWQTMQSCIYLTYGGVIASECKNDPTLSVEGLNDKLYKIVLAPEESANGVEYTLDVTYDGEFGRCSDYYQAGYLGMSIEDINFLLGVVGLLVVSALFGSLTYVILTLGNF